MSHFSLLSDLIDLDGKLEKDSTTDLDSRRQRDRRFGRSLQHDRNQPVAQIRAWLHEITVGDAPKNGPQGARLYHVLCVVLLVTGLLTGWGLASAALYYDGQQPINVVNAVLVLVLPQDLFAGLVADSAAGSSAAIQPVWRIRGTLVDICLNSYENT